MNWTPATNALRDAVKNIGTSVAITRLGEDVLKTIAAFSGEVVADDKSSPISSFSQISSSTGTAYIIGAYKNPPQPGDTLTGKGRVYVITSVELYQPGPTVIGFKLGLQ